MGGILELGQEVGVMLAALAPVLACILLGAALIQRPMPRPVPVRSRQRRR